MALDAVIVEYRLEIDQLRKDLAAVKKDVSGIDKQAEVSGEKASKELNKVGNTVKGSLSQAFEKLGTVIIATFATTTIANFISSSVKLAKTAEEVKGVFDRINDPALLANLRKEVKGTVSDLELMKLAISANNFKIPLQDLGKLLNFARLKADEGKGSFDQLAASIIESVGRNSARALVQLGIGQEAINEKVKETGSLYKGMTAIIDTELAAAGEDILSVADKQDQVSASIENTKVKIGTILLPALNNLLTAVYKVLEGWNMIFNPDVKFFDDAVAQMTRTLDQQFKYHSASQEQMTAVITKELSKQETKLKDLNNQYNRLDSGINSIFSVRVRRSIEEQIGVVNGNIAALKGYGVASDGAAIKSEILAGAIEEGTIALKDNVRDVQEYVEKLNKMYEMSGTNAIDYWKSPQDVMKEQVDNAEAVVDWVNKIISSYEKAGINLIEYNTEIDNSSENIEGLIGWIEKQQEAMRYAGVEIVEYAQIPLSPEEELDKAISDWQNYAGAVFSVIDSITGYFSQQSDYRGTILESELESGRISQEEYDKKTAELRKKQAEKEKLLAIFQVLVNTPPAIMKATADLGIPGAVLATIAAAVQLATALSLDVPKFAKGVIDLQGAGTGTSDSITAKVSKGESVMTAKETRTYKPVLKAIRDGNFEEYIYGNYLKKIEAKRQKQQTGYDDYRIYLALSKGQNLDRKNTDRIIDALHHNQHRF